MFEVLIRYQINSVNRIKYLLASDETFVNTKFKYQILVNFTEAMEEEQSRQQLQTENPIKRKNDLNKEGISLHWFIKAISFVNFLSSTPA